jgi:hypothetical protein
MDKDNSTIFAVLSSTWAWWFKYLPALDINTLPLDLVVKKLDQLEAELEILLLVWLLHSDMKH